jgi:predicted SAM-dependent methyltransferase
LFRGDNDSFKKEGYINRILIAEGEFYISVPNMDVLCALFINPKATYNVKFSLMRMMFGGQIDGYDYHYFGWNYEFMVDFLAKANFSKFKRVESLEVFKDTSELKAYGHKISLNMIAVK